MARKTISVPDDLMKEMGNYPETNWSAVAQDAFVKVLTGKPRFNVLVKIRLVIRQLAGLENELSGRRT